MEKVGYNSMQIAQDRAAIKVNITQKAKGPYCKMNEFAIVSFKGWDETGALRYDTNDQEYKKHMSFKIGHYQVSKCWDIVAQQMKQGEIAKVFCPGSLDIGGKARTYGTFGNSEIPSGEDMDYEIEMKECDLDPLYFTMNPPDDKFKKGEPLRQFDMFYLISNIKNVYKNQMVLDVEKTDKYAPLKTGVYNIFLNEKAETDTQTWWYDADSMTIRNKFHAGKGVILEGFNKNLVLYTYKNLATQRFFYNPSIKHMVCDNTLNVFKPDSMTMLRKSNIITTTEELAKEFIWDIEYTGESAPIPWQNKKSSSTGHDLAGTVTKTSN